MYEPESCLLEVQSKCGANWSHLIAAKDRAEAKRKELRDALIGKDSADVSIIFLALWRGMNLRRAATLIGRS